jgi:hypothetical protein
MKKLALIMIFGVVGVALSAEEYTIQTISAQNEASITPAFNQKVQKSALPMTKKKEGNCNIVTVGEYKTPKEAHSNLKKAKMIAKDAFVRPMERVAPKACESASETQKVAMSSDVNASIPAPKKEISVIEPIVAKVAPVESNTTVVAVIPVVAAAPMVVTQSEKKEEPCKAQPCVVTNDRNQARKSDISEAIEFYKNSPYYSFQPVAILSSK